MFGYSRTCFSKPVCKSASKRFPQKNSQMTTDSITLKDVECFEIPIPSNMSIDEAYFAAKKTTLKIRSPTFTAEKASVPPHEPCQPASSDLSTDHRSSVAVQPMATVRRPANPETVTGSLGWYMLATTCFVDRLEMVEQMYIQPTQVPSKCIFESWPHGMTLSGFFLKKIHVQPKNGVRLFMNRCSMSPLDHYLMHHTNGARRWNNMVGHAGNGKHMTRKLSFQVYKSD